MLEILSFHIALHLDGVAPLPRDKTEDIQLTKGLFNSIHISKSLKGGILMSIGHVKCSKHIFIFLIRYALEFTFTFVFR